MKHYTATEIKKLNAFSISGNFYENTCVLNLYNWDDDTEIESDSVYIELTQKDIRSLIKCLSLHLKPEEETNGTEDRERS